MSEPDDRLVRRVLEAAAGAVPAGPCPEPELLGLYAERALDADEQRQIEAHVASCDRCQATVAAFVRGAPDAAEVAGAAIAAGTGSTWWSGWRWLVPATATAAVAAVALWVGQGPSKRAAMPPPPDPAAAVVESADLAGRSTANLQEQTAEKKAATGDSREATAFAPSAPPATPPQARLERAQPAPPRQDGAREHAFADRAAPAAAAPAPPAPVPVPALPPPPPPAAVQPPAEVRERAVTAAPEPLAAAGAMSQRQEAESSRMADSALAKATAARITELTGRIIYRTRQALPPGATIDVQLLDASRADAPSTTLGRTGIVTKGEQVPVPFTLRYDAGVIDPRRRYTVQATITIGGRVAFRTTTAHPVLTNGAPSTDVEVVVEPMR